MSEHFTDKLRSEGSLQDYADELRQARIGHGDALPEERSAQLRAYLWCRLAEWRAPTDEWDALVKRMVEIELNAAANQKGES